MNTFHISPSSELAAEVFNEVNAVVKERGGDVYVAVRGEVFDGEEMPYGDGVFIAPNQGRPEGVWKYVLAGEWIREYWEARAEEYQMTHFNEVI